MYRTMNAHSVMIGMLNEQIQFNPRLLSGPTSPCSQLFGGCCRFLNRPGGTTNDTLGLMFFKKFLRSADPVQPQAVVGADVALQPTLRWLLQVLEQAGWHDERHVGFDVFQKVLEICRSSSTPGCCRGRRRLAANSSVVAAGS